MHIVICKMGIRKAIPNAIRQQVWLTYNGEVYNAKCNVKWCKNIITPFSFEAGHNIPHSKGGMTSIENLRPICPACNRSMVNKYTIDQFNKLGGNNPSTDVPIKKQKRFAFCFCSRFCFSSSNN